MKSFHLKITLYLPAFAPCSCSTERRSAVVRQAALT